jgi:hypothetical protein
MSSTRESCGCRHDGHKWTHMCEPCSAAFTETHARWQAEHVERQQAKTTEPQS